jgi:HEAT repeat protein
LEYDVSLAPQPRVAWLLVLTVLLGIPALDTAQSVPDIATIEKLITAQDYERAWNALEKTPDSPKVLRLRIRVALAQEKLSLALSQYEALESSTGQPDPAIRAIGQGAARELQRGEDPAIRIGACRVLLAAGNAPCQEDLTRLARDPAADLQLRVSALSVLVAHRAPGSGEVLKQLAADAKGRDLVMIASAMRDVPASVAVPILARVVNSRIPEAEYIAATTLGDTDSPAARPVLKAFLDGSPGAGRLAARLSLARLGDRTSIKALDPVLPALNGGDLLAAAEALQAAGDPRSSDLLMRLVNGDHDLLRLHAAAVLSRKDERAARPVIERACADPNPWTRAEALVAYRRAGWPLTTSTRGLLLDSFPWVRLRAAELIMARTTPPAGERAPRRPAGAGPGGARLKR